MSHWTGVYDATRMTPARDYPVAELYEDLAVGGWHTYEEETARLSRLSQIEWTARPSWKTLVARKIDRTLARIGWTLIGLLTVAHLLEESPVDEESHAYWEDVVRVCLLLGMTVLLVAVACALLP